MHFSAGSRWRFPHLLSIALTIWTISSCTSKLDERHSPIAESVQLFYRYGDTEANSVDVYVNGRDFNLDISRNSSCDNKNAFVIDDNYAMSLTVSPLGTQSNPVPPQPQDAQWMGPDMLTAKLPRRPTPNKYDLELSDPFGSTTTIELVIMGRTNAAPDDGNDTDSNTSGNGLDDSDIDTESDTYLKEDAGTETDNDSEFRNDTESDGPTDTGAETDHEADSETDFETDTQPILTLCEQARLRDPDIVCCPDPIPRKCTVGLVRGCCSNDLSSAYNCYWDVWEAAFVVVENPCIWGTCAPSLEMSIDTKPIHFCTINHCSLPTPVTALSATATIHWYQQADTFSPLAQDNCGDGFRDLWFEVPLLADGELEVFLLSGDDVHIQHVTSCNSSKCEDSVESPSHLLAPPSDNENTALIVISQAEDNPEGASAIRFQRFEESTP